MQLIADRFVADGDAGTTDLATGACVSLRVSTEGGATEQAWWAERCAWFSSLTHPAIAPLIDYGMLGEHRRFEAWGASPGWSGSRAAAQEVCRAAHGFLGASGRTAAAVDTADVGTCYGRAVMIPGAAHGMRRVVPPGETTARSSLGIVLPPDRRLGPLLDLLESQAPGRPSAMAVWAPDLSGAANAILQIARAARLGGAVPVCPGQFQGEVRRLLAGRTLLIVAGTRQEDGWRALMEAALHAERRHAVCFVGTEFVRRVHLVTLGRLGVDVLMASVHPPQAPCGPGFRRVTTAARRARGSRQRFERLIFGNGAPAARPGRTAPSTAPARAAEDTTTMPVHTVTEMPGCSRVGAWAAPGELLRLSRQTDVARRLIAGGRIQPAERLLRQVMHAYARRGEWAMASDAAVLLGRTLRRRGRHDAAVTASDAAADWALHAGDLPRLQASALLRATLLVDDGRPGDAELVVEPLLASALSGGGPLAVDAALMMARTLFWQGRYPEASHRLASVGSDGPSSAADAVRLLAARSRVAVGLGRVAEAVALSAAAREQALATADPRAAAGAYLACAFAQLSAGDSREARLAAARAMAQSRAARHPRSTLLARFLLAESARRLGDTRVSHAVVARYLRLARPALPGLARGRLEVLRDTRDAGGRSETGQRCAIRFGLPALALFAQVHPSAVGSPAHAADEIVALLQCCQEARDDRSVLVAVCARLRGRLRAAGVGFFAADPSEPVLVASDGARPDAVLAARVMAAGQLVVPADAEPRPESGLPVRYAGQTIGALVATWMPAGSWDASALAMLLSTGAAAAGPALSGLIAARVADRRARTSELLGVSEAAAHLRRAVDGASGAPFAVLVEGESGSGKELVARLLHKLGPRRDRPFCTLNCAALPDDLVESELFGHARGAFTGAVAERRGVFEDAHTGTLFLDEVGELSPRAQAKLLRAIQEGEIRRVGENVSRRVDVRLVTATNRNLRAEVAAGRFRLDLLYRLDVIRIAVPPLRDRRDDIPVLAEHIWRDATGRVGSRATLLPATLEALRAYDWPGNVRELQNVLAALAVRCPKRGLVPPTALPTPIAGGAPRATTRRLDQARQAFDRDFIRAALVRAGGRRARAARELGVSRQGLAKLMGRLEIAGEEVGQG
ncbi:MAG: sigma 54-interacting transcriptional regulator [Vicinamibacterales bacterium]